MAILQSVSEARARGASADSIISEIERQNPQKADVFAEARKRGASPDDILNEILRQNASNATSSEPSFWEKAAKGAGNFITGAAKGAAETAKDLAFGKRVKVGDQSINTPGLVTMSNPVAKVILDAARNSHIGTNLESGFDQQLKPDGTAQNFGYGAEKVAEMFTPTGAESAGVNLASKVAMKGEGLIPKVVNAVTRTVSGAATEAADVGAKTLFQTDDVGEARKALIDTALLGGAFRGLGEVKRAIGPQVASRVVNSLIKPLLKDFSYGKNPGAGVAREGIVANSLDDLANKINKKRNEVGQAIDKVLSRNTDKVIDASDALSPIDEAINKAVEGGPANASLVKRLQDEKQAILFKHTLDGNGNIVKMSEDPLDLSKMTPLQARELKTKIGDMARWTGNQTDDEASNKALRDIYGKVRAKIEEAVPQTKAFNERYANLTSAGVATKYRDKLASRQDLISMPMKVGGAAGIITALATGGSGLIPVLSAFVGVAGDKAISSPAFKTRLGSWLMRLPPEDKQRAYKAIPALIKMFGENENNDN